MANITSRLTLAGLAILIVTGAVWLGFASTDRNTAAVSAASPAGAPATVPAPGEASGAAVDPRAAQALLNTPAVQTYQARLQFMADYRRFMQEAAALSAEQRRRQAEALARQIDQREAAAELALSEALLLQLGLAQVQGGDEETQKAHAEQLLARYQMLSQAREARAKVPDARFSQYKSEEKRIVDEVLALDSIPDGLSRDQYLRQRLQEAREQAYQ
ncbi:hypothetical protein HNE05_18295 [Aquipseudomonas campi]|uniref:Uncharacterized protein n=1 Tax=Aquipseudomonas campi TaxID=2731681 RepID=A0A6M8FG65_9GAMM|nr:hypothetical protein [Pseudomonas campi]QKE65223.1 hypothetical protein HNE05_18295 [Pseudomonas campi]